MSKPPLLLLGLWIALSLAPAVGKAQTATAPGLRVHAQLGGSLWGEGLYEARDTSPSAPPSAVKPCLDARLGASLLLHRYFSVDLAAGYTNWQTSHFDAYGRGRSGAVHARLGPALRVPLGRRERAPSLFTSLSAGPTLTFLSEQVPHVKVTEQNEPRVGFVAAWAQGVEVPLVAGRFGLRVQLDWEWMRLRSRTLLQGPAGPVGARTYDHLIRRPPLLVGIWVQP